ncbi:MAG: HAD-IA family hydrolase [Treponema sp.]|nr:HAD-IA family hydrolase [Treponema sp.]
MIKHILFDLDSTLYSINLGLEDFFFSRVREYCSSYLGLSWEEIESIWKEAVKRCGTTLEWLRSEKGFTAIDDYLHYVHPEDEVDCIKPDSELRAFLESLPCPCSILTNSPGFHAQRVIKKLGIEGVFEQVIDIEINGFKGKPHASAFYRALNPLGLEPKEVLFVDDYPRYVNGYLEIGGPGVLIDENDVHKNWPYEKIRNIREITRFLA